MTTMKPFPTALTQLTCRSYAIVGTGNVAASWAATPLRGVKHLEWRITFHRKLVRGVNDAAVAAAAAAATAQAQRYASRLQLLNTGAPVPVGDDGDGDGDGDGDD
jgi:hypothetical protein